MDDRTVILTRIRALQMRLQEWLRRLWPTAWARREVILAAAGLAAVLAVGAWLRLTRVRYGLPYPVWWDEPFVVNAGLRILGTGEWKPQPITFIYGTLPIYVSALASSLAFLSDASRGLVRTPAEFSAPSPFITPDAAFAMTTAAPSAFLAGRLVSVLYGLGTVAAVYLIGRRLGLRAAGLFGAALVAISAHHIYNTTVATVDGPATLFMTLGLLAAVAVVGGDHRGYGWYLACGVTCGLAMACKANSAVAVTLLPVAHALAPRGVRWPRHLVLGLAAIPAAFLLGEPYALLSYSDFMYGMGINAYHYGFAGHPGADVTPGLTAVTHYVNETASMLGGVGSVLALAGTIFLLLRRPRVLILLLTFAFGYVAAMSRLKVFFPRNALPLLPLGAVLASAGLGGLADSVLYLMRKVWTRRGSRGARLVPWAVRAGLVGGLVAVAVMPALQDAADTSRQMARTLDSRERAARWLQEHASAGSRVAISTDLPFHMPSLQRTALIPFRLDLAAPCDLGQHGFGYLVSPRPVGRDRPLPLRLIAEMPGAPLAMAPLFSPQLFIYEKVVTAGATEDLADGCWHHLSHRSVDASNQPFFEQAFFLANGYRQLAFNGLAVFAPVRARGGTLQVHLVAAGSYGGGRYPILAVGIRQANGDRVMARKSVRLSAEREEYTLEFDVRGPGTYDLQLLFEDDFYAEGLGDRNVYLYGVEMKWSR